MVPLAVGVVLAALLAPPVHAQADKRAGSVGMIPADAGFYSAMLRNKEQMDLIAQSKAWATLKDLPAVKLAWQMLEAQVREGNLKPVGDFFAQPDNRELLDVLADAGSQEIFFYGGPNWVQFVELLGILQDAGRFGPVLALIERGGEAGRDPSVHFRPLLHALAAHPQLIVVPDFIWGCKLSDTTRAQKQIGRLEELATGLADQNPHLKGRVKNVKIGEDSFLTVNLDGSMVPWDQIPFKALEQKEGEFDALISKLKELKLSLCLGIRKGYLLFAFGAAPEVVTQFGGTGEHLTQRPELKPLVAALDRPLTSIGYTSAALRGGAVAQRNVDSFLSMARQALDKADIAADKRKKIVQDLEGMSRDLLRQTPEAGAEVSFSYMTERGYENFIYDHSKNTSLDGSRPLTLLSHVGGDPIGAAVVRRKRDLQAYRHLGKWARTLYGDVEDVVLEKLDKEQREQYERISKEVFPLLRRLDEITGTMLLPALADGQSAIVLDGKWSSKQWQKDLSATPTAMPLPELALVLGVSDADLMRKALGSSRELFNDALAKAKELAPAGANVPDIQIPPPEKSEGAAGQLFSYAPPAAWGLDEQVRLTVGLSDKVFVVAPSQALANRILESKPLRVQRGPLSDLERPLAAAGYFSWPRFVDMVAPWVEYGVSKAPLPGAGEGPPGLSRDDVRTQVRTLLRVLKVFRGYSSAVYFEDGVLVTHGETVIRDLDASKR
jgi:hypothetical protein